MSYRSQLIALNLMSSASATRDDNSTAAVVKIKLAGGPESLTDLFITQGADVVVIAGEPRLSTNRTIQSIPHYDDWEVPLTLRAINRWSGGSLVSSAPIVAGKLVDSYLNLLQVPTIAHGSDYELTATAGQGRVVRHAGTDLHEITIMVKVRIMV